MKVKFKVMVYPTILAFSIGKALGKGYMALAQVRLDDGRVYSEYVELKEK